jgi:UDP-N-acetylmuramyl pentapeptide phosphotransferase/UDP-N-acetylglucosamine-1-phosphate transferase
VIFFLVFFIVSYFFVEHNYKLYLLWFFGGIITAISFVDDRLNVSAKIRLIIQILIGAVI